MSASGKSSNRRREKRRAMRGGGGNGPYASEGRRIYKARLAEEQGEAAR